MMLCAIMNPGSVVLIGFFGCDTVEIAQMLIEGMSESVACDRYGGEMVVCEDGDGEEGCQLLNFGD